MTAQLLDGRQLAKALQAELRSELAHWEASPTLAVLQVGDDAATTQFGQAQEQLAHSLGLQFVAKQLTATVTQETIEAQIAQWNRDAGIHGIVLLTPLPKRLDLPRLAATIEPIKDVEGISPYRLGRRSWGGVRIGPCTALAVMALIESTKAPLRGKEAVVIGKSDIVGRPVAMFLLDAGVTTTVCHTGTTERGRLQEHVERAEILVVAAGTPGLVKGGWVRPGAMVVDVGTNVVNGRTVGDVEFEEAAQRARWITPVPGGVGPLTVTMVMKSTVEAFTLQQRS